MEISNSIACIYRRISERNNGPRGISGAAMAAMAVLDANRGSWIDSVALSDEVGLTVPGGHATLKRLADMGLTESRRDGKRFVWRLTQDGCEAMGGGCTQDVAATARVAQVTTGRLLRVFEWGVRRDRELTLAHLAVLARMRERPGEAWSTLAVARACGIDRGGAWALLGRMKAMGYVGRERGKWRVTPAGVAVTAALFGDMAATGGDPTNGID